MMNFFLTTQKRIFFISLILSAAFLSHSQIEIAIKYSSSDCASCQIQIPALLKQHPQTPFYCKSTDVLELQKLLSNFPDILDGNKPIIKQIESGSEMDTDRKSALVINDLTEKRLVFYKPLNELKKEDFTLLHLFYTDLHAKHTVLVQGNVKGKKKGIFFDEIVELTSQRVALVQHNGYVHQFDLQQKRIVSSKQLLTDEINQNIFLSLYGKQYVDSLQKDETIQGFLQLFPNSVSAIKKVRGKYYGILKFLHVQNFKEQAVDYGFALLTFTDDLNGIAGYTGLDINENKVLPYGISYTEKEEWLFVSYAQNEPFLFHKMDVDKPTIFEPYFPLKVELDSFQNENRGIFLGNSTYLNGFVAYGMSPILSNTERLFDFSAIVQAINMPKKVVDPPMEINGYKVDDNTFVQVRIEMLENEIHSIFRHNDFLFKLRFNKENMAPIGLSRLFVPDGKTCVMSNNTVLVINPETWEYQLIK